MVQAASFGTALLPQGLDYFRTKNSELYQDLSQEIVRATVYDLKFKRGLIHKTVTQSTQSKSIKD